MPSDEAPHIKVLTLDTETTGLGPNDEPISLGMLLCTVDVKSGRAVGEAIQYQGMRKPTVPIHPAARKVHGIQDHALEGLDFEHSKVRDIIIAADVIISHHAAYDARMLQKLYPEITQKPWRCTWRQWPWTSKTEARKLSNAAELCGIQPTTSHQALGDAQTLWQCLQTPTGKTARSRVYLHKLLASPAFQLDYYIAQDVKQRAPADQPSARRTAKRTWLWIGVFLLILILVKCAK